MYMWAVLPSLSSRSLTNSLLWLLPICVVSMPLIAYNNTRYIYVAIFIYLSSFVPQYNNQLVFNWSKNCQSRTIALATSAWWHFHHPFTELWLLSKVITIFVPPHFLFSSSSIVTLCRMLLCQMTFVLLLADPTILHLVWAAHDNNGNIYA